jgi:TrpR family trp operon transcriptional repressor
MDENFIQISEYLARLDSPERIQRFLVQLLTPAEVKDLASRWHLLRLLNKGVTQRKIAKELHLSLCKITRGSKELKKENSILKEAIQAFE